MTVLLRQLRLILILTQLALLSYSAAAQEAAVKGPGKITGRVVDSVSGRAVEYATISLVQEEGNKVINGVTTDDKGFFKITGIADGKYSLLIYFIGYKTNAVKNINISGANPVAALADIKLASAQTLLKEVDIVTEKSLIENKIDKMVYNAEKDLTSQGGVVTDILKKVPQVAIDVNGNVELQGNSNIRFLINGKPSSVFGNNVADVLQTIPASQVQSIEVITSPGAKYDAEGTGGIINIILKKNTAQGINGSLSLSGGSRLENGSFNLGARKGNFGVNAFVSGNAQILTTTLNKLDRLSQDTAGKTSNELIQDGKSDFTREGLQAGISFDWKINKKNSLTGAFTYNYGATTNLGTTGRNSTSLDQGGNILSGFSNTLLATNNTYSKTPDWNLNYKKYFKKEGQEIDILYTASQGYNYSYYRQVQQSSSGDSIYGASYGDNPGFNRQNNFSFNYAHPFSENVLMETGTRAVITSINTRSDVFLLNRSDNNYDYNTTQSSTVNYGRNVYAAYLSGTFKTKIVDFKVGCRYEYTETNAQYSNAGKVNIPSYGTIVPSGIISRNFEKHQLLKLSYSYRIQRPDYRDLNPFLNASDPKNITTGNTGLRPETTHNTELSYSKIFDRGSNLSISLFCRANRDDIQAYTTYYPTFRVGDSTYTNVAVSTRENIGYENNFGSNIFISIPVTSKISIRSNISAFQRYIINIIDPGRNISGFNYRINLNASYQVGSKLSIEVFGNFNSPRINAQGIMPSFTTYNFAFRRQLFNRKGSIALTATNPFNKYVDQRTKLSGTNFTVNGLVQMPYRSFGINFTYKFGKLEFKKEKNVEDVNLTNPPASGN